MKRPVFVTALMTRDEQAREMARQSAIDEQGYEFIELVRTDPKVKRIGAVDTVLAQRTEGTTGPMWVPKLVTGDEIFHNYSGSARFTIWLLDTPYNRRFLASHHSTGAWKLTDPDVEAEIATMAAEMRKNTPDRSPKMAIDNEPGRPMVRPLPSQFDPKNLSDGELDATLEKLLEQKRMRNLANGGATKRGRPKKTAAQEHPEQAAPVSAPQAAPAETQAVESDPDDIMQLEPETTAQE